VRRNSLDFDWSGLSSQTHLLTCPVRQTALHSHTISPQHCLTIVLHHGYRRVSVVCIHVAGHRGGEGCYGVWLSRSILL
jgi:hypothetical protein